MVFVVSPFVRQGHADPTSSAPPREGAHGGPRTAGHDAELMTTGKDELHL